MRVALRLAYVGTRYRGWQVQAPDLAPLTIQGQLERALARLAGEPVRVFGSGRTDAGVHAEGQVAHFDVTDGRAARIPDWRHALNALLPDDIRVLEAWPAAPDFHARFSAHDKTYRYLFWRERGYTPPRLLPFVWRCGPLDAARMATAVSSLLGTHDFACLANAGSGTGSTVRTITALTLEECPAEPAWPAGPSMLAMTVTGTGFLKQMVRNMAGLMADVGRGRVPARAVAGYLDTRRRDAMPCATAPASGLTLLCVRYGAGRPPGGMPFEQAMILACQGTKMTRPGWGGDFMAVSGGQLRRGHHIGESSFMEMRPWTPSPADRLAGDWRAFTREVYDAWEGCELPQGPGGHGPEGAGNGT